MHKEYLAFKELNYEPIEDGNIYVNNTDEFSLL